LTISGGEEEVRRGGLGGEEVTAEREWGPMNGGDEWRERIGGIGGGRGRVVMS
jgi:hypothetical protein